VWGLAKQNASLECPGVWALDAVKLMVARPWEGKPCCILTVLLPSGSILALPASCCNLELCHLPQMLGWHIF
jgi:hypothetical protein